MVVVVVVVVVVVADPVVMVVVMAVVAIMLQTKSNGYFNGHSSSARCRTLSGSRGAT